MYLHIKRLVHKLYVIAYNNLLHFSNLSTVEHLQKSLKACVKSYNNGTFLNYNKARFLV